MRHLPGMATVWLLENQPTLCRAVWRVPEVMAGDTFLAECVYICRRAEDNDTMSEVMGR